MNSLFGAGCGRTFSTIAGYFLLVSISYGQLLNKSQPYKLRVDQNAVNSSILKLKAGSLDGVDIDLLGRAGAVEAAPLLEQQFIASENPIDKAKIAQVLVELGYKKDTYWNYLVQLATPALESGEPDPLAYDAQGKDLPDISPEFEQWVDANKKAPADALQDAMYVHPGEMLLLGATNDSRAIPLLRKALTVPNYMVEIAAARSLASLKDKGSVPFIIDAASKAPANAANLIAESLGYFDDPQAQTAFEKYVSKDRAQAFRESRAKGMTPLGR